MEHEAAKWMPGVGIEWGAAVHSVVEFSEGVGEEVRGVGGSGGELTSVGGVADLREFFAWDGGEGAEVGHDVFWRVASEEQADQINVNSQTGTCRSDGA